MQSGQQVNDHIQSQQLGSSAVKIGEGNGTPLQHSCVEDPMYGGAWWAAVHGVAKSQTRLSDFTFTFHFHALENPLQCSCLENPRDGGAWWAAVYGVAQSRTRMKRRGSGSSSGQNALRASSGTSTGPFSTLYSQSSSLFSPLFQTFTQSI